MDILPSLFPKDLTHPFMTHAAPAVSGQPRRDFGDFQVDEIPLYEPSGEGEHLYLWIEKKGLSTHSAVRKIARALGKRDKDFGYAGLKDSQGITRQYLSIAEPISHEILKSIQSESLKILHSKHHRNKLRMGHLLGNRFQIRLLDCEPGDLDRGRVIFSCLREEGVPNYFGLQRFGRRFNSHTLGKLLLMNREQDFLSELLGRPDDSEAERFQKARCAYEEGCLKDAFKLWPRSNSSEYSALRSLIKFEGNYQRAIQAIPRRFRFLYATALQSQIFNRYLTFRRELGADLLDGEVVVLERNGAAFKVVDKESEQARHNDFEISASGPLFGSKLLRPQENSQLWELEEKVLADADLTMELFDNSKLGLKGIRRSLRVPMKNPEISLQQPTVLELSFTLPRGCYATAVLEELLHRAVL
jgi:tRNA pseudouridine13 synthase